MGKGRKRKVREGRTKTPRRGRNGQKDSTYSFLISSA